MADKPATTDSASQQYDVAIVGGGPVGLACAAELGMRGLRCVVIEPQVSLRRVPKGQSLMQRSVEHFARWGIAQALRDRAVIPAGHPIGGLVAYKDLESEYWHAPPGREQLTPLYAEANARLPQYCTEAVLREHIAELATVDTFFGSRAVAVTQDADGTRVTFEGTGAGDDKSGEATAKFLIGCDGGGSLVREQAGIPFEPTSRTQSMVLTVFRSKELHERLKRFPPRTTYRVMHPDHKGYWQMFGRVDEDEAFFFHSPIPSDTKLDLKVDGQRIMAEATGFPFACEIDYIAAWEARTAIAARYRNGRIFIAGDACHVHPPYGGYGLNSGFEDAVNLSWKLAASLEGWGNEALLDSYDLERRPVFAETADEVINAWIEHDRKFLEEHSPERDPEAFGAAWATEMAVADTGPSWYEPQYEGSPIVDGPRGGRCGVFGEHSARARPGHALASRSLTNGSRVFDLLGRENTLLAFGVDDGLADAWDLAASELKIPLTIVRDSWDGQRREYGSRLVLVRPDRFVAWVGHDNSADPRTVLGSAAGRGL